MYPERAYGFADTGQTMVGVPDGTVMRLYVDDEPFSLDQAEILDYERVLDMRRGTLERRVVWRVADGSRFRVRSRRVVSLENRHLACIEYEVDRARPSRRCDHLLGPGDPPGERPQTSDGLPVAATSWDRECSSEDREHVDGGPGGAGLPGRASGLAWPAAWITADERHGRGRLPRRYVEGDWARAGLPGRRPSPAGPCASSSTSPTTTTGTNRSTSCASASARPSIAPAPRARQHASPTSARTCDDFWATQRRRHRGRSPAAAGGPLQPVPAASGDRPVEGYGVPAKGLTGRGYEGHYFWDTEIYVMPFLTYTAPHLARNLLRHRYAMLDHARRRARQVGQRGALFPWRTISGDEASAYFAAGTAQYHIDADIAYALMQYVRATGDTEISSPATAPRSWWRPPGCGRTWGSSPTARGRFVINGVTGPDEYAALVDNNTYTNLMARENLRLAEARVEWLADAESGSPCEAGRAHVSRGGGAELWRRAADLMYVPYDKELGLHLQDDGFLDLEPWDFENTPPENYPLLLHYHPLVIYRHQVIKQADVVLATFLLGDAFSAEDKRRILDYYDPLTTGDSSLSECIQSIMAAEVGDDLRAAEEYFVDARRHRPGRRGRQRARRRPRRLGRRHVDGAGLRVRRDAGSERGTLLLPAAARAHEPPLVQSAPERRDSGKSTSPQRERRIAWNPTTN